MRGEAKVTLPQANCISLPRDTVLGTHIVLSAMDGKIEQRVCIKFRVKLGKPATESLKMLRQAFGEHSLSRTSVFEWHSRFKAGRISAEDDEHSGRRSTRKTAKNVAKIRELIHEDRRRAIHVLADTIGISRDACRRS
jgi:hypothetical protein